MHISHIHRATLQVFLLLSLASLNLEATHLLQALPAILPRLATHQVDHQLASHSRVGLSDRVVETYTCVE